MTLETFLTQWVAMMGAQGSAEAAAFRAVVPDLYPAPAPEDATSPFATWSLISNTRTLGGMSAVGQSDCMIDSATIQVDLWDDDPSPLGIVQARDLLFAVLEGHKPASSHLQLFRGEQLLPEPEVGYHAVITYEYLTGN